MSNIEFPFFAFPQAFIYSESLRDLPPYAKLLYMLLLDRVSLSEKNEDVFADEKGIFIFFSEQSAAEILNCSRSSITRSKRILEEKGLIESEEQGKALPCKIRVYISDEIFTKVMSQNDAALSLMRQKDASGCVRKKQHDASKCITNQTDNIHTYNNHTYPHQGDEEELTRMFKEPVEYDVIACGENRAVLDGLIMIMCEMYICTDKDILIGGKHYPADYVRKRLRRINSESIMDVYYRIDGNRAKVKEASGYVKKLLFEAPAAGIISASLDYGHDFNQ